ncbi:hypothetical protein VYU27_008293 [Nannochloropsis oceanica]
MKLSGAFFITLFASLVFHVVGDCPSLRPFAETSVVNGQGAFYKVRIAGGSEAIKNATFSITLPDGVSIRDFEVWPRRRDPLQNGTVLTWSNVSMRPYMRSSFHVTLGVNLTSVIGLNGSTGCTSGEISFQSTLSDGDHCNVDAPAISTKVENVTSGQGDRCGGSSTPYTAKNQSVFSWGTYKPFDAANLHINGIQNCLDACADASGFFVAWKPNPEADDCYCQSKSQYLVDGVEKDTALSGYTIFENPAELHVRRN